MSVIASSSADIVRRGEEVFQRDIEGLVANDYVGYFVVLDIESGDFEVDKQDVSASLRLLARRPNAVTYAVRIGSRSAYRLGGAERLSTS